MSEGSDNKKQEEQNTTPSEPRKGPDAEVSDTENFTEDNSESAEKETQISNEETSSGSESSSQEAEDQQSPAFSEDMSKDAEVSTSEDGGDSTNETITEKVEHKDSEEETESDDAITAKDDDNKDSVNAEKPNQEDAENEDSDNEDAEEENKDVDFSNYSKEELANVAEAQLKSDDIKKADRLANEMKLRFDELETNDRLAALEKFISEGGTEDDFDYRSDEISDRFYQAYKVIKERKSSFYAKRNQDLNQNYETKLDVLNRIRDFVDSEETQVSINKLKDLQNEWRSIGRVPAQHNRNLWANYHALINRFYDNRSIYFELKELDRKKNMESKLELCDKAEALSEEEDLKKALQGLDELHEEYKHIGPVPKEEQEALWSRFKAASDVIHDRRREQVGQFKEELKDNLDKKLKICDEVAQYADFQSDSIKEWNQKTKEIQEVQKRWEAVGPMPREKAKDVNKKFWTPFKQFFAHKGEFFKKLDAQREENLEKKQNLLEQAEQLSESNDWQKAANELKRLQREWKEIGPVPERQRNVVYKKFKTACDKFFERKREINKEQEAEFQQNLETKEAICEKIEKLAAENPTDTEKLQELSEEYAKVGFVPRNAIKKIGKRYEKALDSFMGQATNLNDQEKEDLKLEMEVTTMKGTPRADRKLDNKEFSLRKKISRLEEDISLWNNNISFFGHSKGAEKLREDYEKKIEEASVELEHLKSQLNTIENMR